MGKSSDFSSMNENEIMQMLKDTSELAAKKQVQQMQIAASAYKASNELARNVEFWTWMDKNFNSAGIFSSNQSMNRYISQSSQNADWVRKQLQGKGFEWDWMQQQRACFRNIFKRYDAGSVSNQAAIDVTEYDFLSRSQTEYQMKAYTSQNNPHLQNTGKEVTVVTNAEKINAVSCKGYTVEKFKNKWEIINDVDKRMNEIKNGTATPSYSVKNISSTMAKAGLMGCMFGVGTESLHSYKRWKNAELTDDEYLSEILRSGGEAGVSTAVITGIMIPVSSTITAFGVSSVVTVPVAFAVSSGVSKIVSPCFGRGDYRKILFKAKYYHSLEQMYVGFMQSIDIAAQEYEAFSKLLLSQEHDYRRIKQKDKIVTKALKDLYDLI